MRGDDYLLAEQQIDRTVLLATNDTDSVLGEVDANGSIGGGIRPTATPAVKTPHLANWGSTANWPRRIPAGKCWAMAIVPTARC